MSENAISKNIKIFLLLNKKELTNDEFYYLMTNYDNKEKVVKKFGIEKIFGLKQDKLKEILKLKLSNDVTLFKYCFEKIYSKRDYNLIDIYCDLAANEFELFKVLFQFDNMLNYLFDKNIKISDEILLSEYNGKKILEYWLIRKIMKNSKISISSIKNPDILLELAKLNHFEKLNIDTNYLFPYLVNFYKEFTIDNIDQSLLLTKDELGKTLLEKIIEYSDLYSENVALTPEIIKVLLKCNKLAILAGSLIDNKILLTSFNELCEDSQKGNFDGTLLDYLFENKEYYKLIEFLNFEAILVYINNDKLFMLTNKVLKDEVLLHSYKGETLLDYLFQQNINIDLSNNKNPNILKLCCKYKKFDYFIESENNYVQDEIFDIIIENNKTLLDYMLENGINPWPKLQMFKLQNIPRDIKLVLKLLKYGYYDRVLETNDDILLYEIDKDKNKTIFDVVLEQFPIINNKKNKDDLIEALKKIKYGSSCKDLENISSEILLLEYDIENHRTILNLILTKWDLDISNTSLINRKEIAEWLVYNKFEHFLIHASKEILLQKIPYLGNKTILQLILEKHSSFVSFISDDIIKDPEIMYVVFITTGTTKNFKYSMEKAQNLGLMTDKQLESLLWQTDGLLGPIDLEGEELLKEFIEVMNTGNKSDNEILQLAVLSFRKLIINNNPLGIIDLKRVIELKRANPDFCMKYNIDKGSFLSAKNAFISLKNKYDIISFEHELTHAFHHYFKSYETPDEFKNILKRINENPKFMDKVLQFMERMQKLYDEVFNLCIDSYSKQISEKYIFEIFDQFHARIDSNDQNVKQNFVIDLINSGISEETIKDIMAIFENKNINVDDVRAKYANAVILRDEISYAKERFVHDFNGELHIENFLDALMNGKLDSETEKRFEKYSAPTFTHNQAYYSKSESLMFAEIIAIYSSIRKAENNEYLLNLLKEIVGEELLNFLDNYYMNELALAERKVK